MESLLLSRRFAPLFWCQFFSAFGDNFLKNALVMTILFSIGGSQGPTLVTLAGAVFIAPFFLLSACGGELADRFDKALIARWLKLAEIGIAALAVAGFWLLSIPTLFLALLGFGIIGALFGPLKYGILPDLLERSRLPMANALVEGATFLAILFGTIVGGLAAHNGGDPWRFSGLMIVLAALSLVSSLFIPKVGSRAPELQVSPNVFASTWAVLVELKREPRLWWGGLASSWFWGVGAVVMSLLPTLVKDTLGGTEDVATVFLAVFSVAVAVGSGLAAWLCAGRVILLPAVIGAMLLGILSCDVAWTIWGAVPNTAGQSVGAVFSSTMGLRLAFDLGGMAIASGLFIVPVFAALQSWANPERRGRVIAGVNVLNSAFMVIGAGIIAGLQAAGLALAVLFALIGLATLAAAYAIAKTMPANGLMDFLSMIFRAFYRLEVHGAEHFEAAGPNAIIALNHVSFLDAALALSILPREPIFAIDSGMAKKWWVKPFLRFTNAMPLDPTSPIGTRTLIRAVAAGSPLVIFPEGRLTVTGSLMKVYDGAGLIADKTGAMVVPVRLEGLQYTQFTRLRGTQVRKRWFPKIVVTALPPSALIVDEKLKGKHRRQAAGAALYEIMSNLVYQTTSIERTIPEALIEAAEVHGMNRIAVEDPISGALSYRKLLVGMRVLGEKLTVYAEKGKTVGVMLPNSNGTAVVIMGLMSAARVPAMINFTAGSTNVRAACRAAEVGTILTSKAFVEKARLEPLLDALRDVRIVFLEDLRATVSLLDKIRGRVNHRAPVVKCTAGDWAAVLFTSGSEGTPKGVVLTHRNILANAAQAAARIDFGREDKLFSVLPVFHSFGLTVGTVLPLVSGVPVYFYPSPLHYRIVPELVYGTNATILLGTDTFLNGYARAAHAYDFRSLRYILAGAEPVKERTRQVYMEKFGIRLLEGYGVTETGPALAFNTPMFTRYGTVGRLLPGVSYRLEKVEGIEDGGRLWVSGPNIMAGYLRAEEPGVLHPPEQGWHDTGDIVTVDDQGFVKIQGRAKRFAKIAGEMVSLAAVEALAAALWPDAPSAVVALPDPRKGERLVLVTEKPGATRAAFQAYARSQGATELMVPADFVHMEKLPVLGSGKIDNVAIGKLALERTSPPPEAFEPVERDEDNAPALRGAG